ncbi:MAG: choice-of-anchor Q domain-containing protein [Marinicella sp.]
MKTKHFFILLLLIVGQVKALTFHAFVLSDEIDNNPGDGVCEIPAGMSLCSLRAAIIEANALGGSHTIELSAGTYQLTILGEETSGFAGDLNVNGASLTIVGAGIGQTIIDANTNHRVFHVSNNAQFNLSDLTITGGRASTAGNFTGGAISVGGADATVEIDHVIFDSNSANAGGAIYATTGVDINVTHSVFQDNFTEALGFTNLNGPAIFCNACDLTLENSTVIRNDMGGKAIDVESGSILMTNSTVTDNEGGGLRTTNSNGVIRFSTFVSDGGQNLSHFSFDDSHVVNVANTILYTDPNAFVDNCQSGDKPVSGGYNVVSDLSCEFVGTGDSQDTDALLGPLGYHGGIGSTFLPMGGSAAIDKVPTLNCLSASGAALTGDQRGVLRPNGTSCDTGAVEVVLDLIFDDGFEG